MCKDKQILNSIIKDFDASILTDEQIDSEVQKDLKFYYTNNVEFPLDKDVLNELQELNNAIKDDDDYSIFESNDKVIKLWNNLIIKAIKCLRFNDSREPFKKQTRIDKKPLAYGVEELFEYYKDYIEFEKVLYGGASYYRDHVLHVFRVWMLGVKALAEDNFKYLDKIDFQDFKIGNNKLLTSAEKISIWTLIALTHDLGYPLEKAKNIIDHTQKMVKSFINNPSINMNLSFDGTQNNMNDFVIKFISSKMTQLPNTDNADPNEKIYVSRLQSKYYFKFQKSLEHNAHGILSSLIIYKLLLYFLESDFSLNEDYKFNREEARQFFIRREILRAIASHTCSDIYHMNCNTFSFLLIIADDAQDWGRKGIENLYIEPNVTYSFGKIKFTTTEDETICTVNDSFVIPGENTKYISEIISKNLREYNNKKKIFRDGQDTDSRDFSFIKETKIEIKNDGNPSTILRFEICKNKVSRLFINKSGDDLMDNIFKELKLFRDESNSFELIE